MGSGRRQWLADRLEVSDDLFDNLAQFTVQFHRIIAMDAGDQVRALADVHLILFTPFNPFMVLVRLLSFSHLIDGITYLLFLVVIGIVPILPADCNNSPKTRMDEISMRALSAARNKLEAGVAQIVNKLPNLTRYCLMLSPSQGTCKQGSNDSQHLPGH